MVFKIKIILLTFMVFVVCGSYAEQIEHPYFWKVEKDGKTAYILGTMHVAIPIDELMCSETIRDQLKKSDLVFLEANPHSEDFIKAEEQQTQWALSTDGREFQALSEESQAFLRSRGISETLNLYGYDTKLIQLCHRLEDEKSIDSQVNSIADSRKIPIQGLEDYYPARRPIVEENKKRAGLFSQLTEAQSVEEIRRLNHSIRLFPQTCPPLGLVQMIEAYKSGVIVDIMMNMMMRLSEQEMQDLQQRNSQWVDRFEKAHHGTYERIFVAAGLVHFLGPVSFTGMLEEKGYKVGLVNCEQ